MGRVTGLEPATLWTTTRCSNQLSYTRHNKDLGFKPTPLSHIPEGAR